MLLEGDALASGRVEEEVVGLSSYVARVPLATGMALLQVAWVGGRGSWAGINGEQKGGNGL